LLPDCSTNISGKISARSSRENKESGSSVATEVHWRRYKLCLCHALSMERNQRFPVCDVRHQTRWGICPAISHRALYRTGRSRSDAKDDVTLPPAISDRVGVSRGFSGRAKGAYAEGSLRYCSDESLLFFHPESLPFLAAKQVH